MATPPDDMNDDGLESGSAFKPAIPIDVEIAMREIEGWGGFVESSRVSSRSFCRLRAVYAPLIEVRAMGCVVPGCLGALMPGRLRLQG